MVLLSLGLPQHSVLLLDRISSINVMQDSSSCRIRYKFSLIQEEIMANPQTSFYLQAEVGVSKCE